MSKHIKAVRAFLKKDDWNPTADTVEGMPRLYTKVTTDNGAWNFVVVEEESTEIVTFYSTLDNRAPPETRYPIADFITRANFGLKIGNFEMDFEEGKVRFRISIDIESGKLTETMIKNICYTSIQNMNMYYPGFMAVMYGGQNPQAAIAQIEGGQGASTPPPAAPSPLPPAPPTGPQLYS